MVYVPLLSAEARKAWFDTRTTVSTPFDARTSADHSSSWTRKMNFSNARLTGVLTKGDHPTGSTGKHHIRCLDDITSDFPSHLVEEVIRLLHFSQHDSGSTSHQPDSRSSTGFRTQVNSKLEIRPGSVFFPVTIRKLKNTQQIVREDKEVEQAMITVSTYKQRLHQEKKSRISN